ncbi:MAG TPA: ABC transporter permease [Saprospiraceae bacterium]|nr:ABC transporter permease [Saprospiraceae bacterium]
MREIWIIARREFGSFFDSLVAYILLIAFLGFTGFFTWLWIADVFFRKQADLQVFFNVAMWTLFIFIPAITMKQLAEEKNSGTIELLLTKSVTDRQLVLGKFVACFLLVCAALALTIPYYITVANIGSIDHGATISGYFGLLLMSAAYIGIGLFASSVTSNQIVALLLALLIAIFFQFLFNAIGSNFTGWLGELISGLSVTRHFESITRGVIDTKDIIFFLSLALLGILFAELMISKRK